MRVKRQVKLGPYGRADILAWTVFDSDGTKTLLGHVVEVKKEKAGVEAINQLCRYMKGVEIALIDVKDENRDDINDVSVFGSVFCEDITDKDELGYIVAQMQNVHIYRFLVSMKSGIKVKRSPGWILGILSPHHKEEIILKEDLHEAIERSTESTKYDLNYYNPFLSICI